jgi:hypothetical protein
LATAFVMYYHDNRQRFPAPANNNDGQPDDWIHWQTHRDLKESAIPAT